MSKSVAIIQARLGSSRLPGKVCFPLGDKMVLGQVIDRVSDSEKVDEVVVATSNEQRDDILSKLFEEDVYRGSEQDVLGRLYGAAEEVDADVVVRITGDCPLVPPEVIDSVVKRLSEDEADYASNVRKRTFPRGFDVEAFTMESFDRVNKRATEGRHREHVTLFYRENPEEFVLSDVTAREVFDQEQLQDRTDIRLTLDEADDYLLLKKIFDDIGERSLSDVQELIEYIDAEGLQGVNASVQQKRVSDG